MSYVWGDLNTFKAKDYDARFGKALSQPADTILDLWKLGEIESTTGYPEFAEQLSEEAGMVERSWKWSEHRSVPMKSTVRHGATDCVVTFTPETLGQGTNATVTLHGTWIGSETTNGWTTHTIHLGQKRHNVIILDVDFERSDDNGREESGNEEEVLQDREVDTYHPFVTFSLALTTDDEELSEIAFHNHSPMDSSREEWENDSLYGSRHFRWPPTLPQSGAAMVRSCAWKIERVLTQCIASAKERKGAFNLTKLSVDRGFKRWNGEEFVRSGKDGNPLRCEMLFSFSTRGSKEQS